jgi:hypothetical protein
MDSIRKKKKRLDLGAPQFRGGAVTVRPDALIPIGAFSTLQNVRGFHPGFRKRDGQTKLHTTSQLATNLINVPAYNAGTATYAMGYSAKTAASWAGARDAATGDNATISTEHNNSCLVLETGGNYTVGRTFLFFDLSRLAGTCSAASLYIKLRNGTNLASVIAKKFTGTAPDLNSSSDPFADTDFDSFSGDYSAAVDLSGGSADTWVEIPLDAGSPDTAVTDINAASGLTDSSAILGIVLTEYAHDDQDSAPSAAATHDCNFYIGTTGNQPYLSLTMSTTPEISKIFQWSKGRINERHLFAQIEGGDLIESTDEPPTVTTGDFGTVVRQPRGFDSSLNPLPVLTVGYDNQVPASFGDIHDILLYSDGISQHSVFTGQTAKIEAFKKVNGDAALADNPGDGVDYSVQVSDSDPDTYADLSSLGDLTNDYQAFFIKTRFKAKQFNFTVRTANGTAATLKMKSWDKVAGWQDRTITDGTSVSSKTMNQSGTVSWTPDAEEIEFYAFGENGYWYMFYLDAAAGDLDADTTISAVTYEGEWQSLENVWNGVLVNCIEAFHWDNSAAIYFSYPNAGIDLSNMAHTDDTLYVSSDDNLVGLHFDFGATPNTVTTTTVTQVDGWDGDSWVDLTEDDGTNGFNDSGFITWKRNANLQKREFNGSRYSAYWWKITLGTTNMSDDVVCQIRTMPWYDIKDHGAFGRCNAVWKERACYSFDEFPSWLYVSENAAPNVLNGADYALLQAGDGRQNTIVAMAKFHNEMIVWQEEKGRDGGCITLFEGYSPSTFGKLLLSAKIGGFSQKGVVVIDGANAHTRKDDNQQTLAFFISHYGIFVTDGSIVTRISDDIQNYFDPRFSECIRRGYEKQMYVEHDTSSNVLRFGLVSGSSATQPNIFPVLDLIDWTWSFDTIGQAHSHVHEVEAASGQYPVLQIAGSTNGFIYKINDNTVKTDDGTDIDMIAQPEFNSSSRHLNITEIMVRALPVTGSSFTMEVFMDGVEDTDAQLTIDTDDPADGQNLIRERVPVDIHQASNVSLKFRSNNDEDCYLYDFNTDMTEDIER